MTVDAGCSIDALIEAYTQHSRRVRGLRDRTLHQHAALARQFVHAVQGDGPVDLLALAPLRRDDICRLVERAFLSPFHEDGVFRVALVLSLPPRRWPLRRVDSRWRFLQ